ncbi:MFS transporter [Microlunatus endophyticus]|uniref:MFS transporter n=1 Tax=Microlunatus endophyticus TaxID=1716077 RepID=A0A917SFP9_9ACTN|nr:MFS transporter [Microlunatus endophyticus]GGL79504.1 MFS transporter [Microlunatus endophyticus]
MTAAGSGEGSGADSQSEGDTERYAAERNDLQYDENHQGDPPARSRWLTPGVVSVGATSLFSDTGHEMVTALLPSFLTSLGGSAAALGIIEGFSDALTGVTKVAGGPLADMPERRRRMAGGGYLLTAVATGAIGLTVATWQVGILRAVAWSARGFRSPARDSLLASLVNRRAQGRAFGVERAGDNLGAVVGPLLAGALILAIGTRPTMIIAAVPGLLAAVAIGFAAREARRRRTAHDGAADKEQSGGLLSRYGQLRGSGLGRRLIPILLFECGNVAATILILRGTELLNGPGSVTAAAATVTALYAAHNLAAAITSVGAGVITDRRGARIVFAIGSACYLISYLGFSWGPTNWIGVGALFVLGGVGIGCAETAESVLVSTALPDTLRGSGFGALGLTQAVGDLVATVVAGILYTAVSGPVAFGYAAAWMLLALIANALLLRTTGSGNAARAQS